MKIHLVLTIGNSDKLIPIAWSRNRNKAANFADMSVRDSTIRTVTDVQLLNYLETFILTELK